MPDKIPFKISVSSDALFQILSALQGPGYLIRELQVIAGLPGDDDPLSILIKEYNDAIIKKKANEKKLEDHSP